MIVELNSGEMAVAHFLATMRRCVNQSSKVTDQRRDKKLQAIELDILGLVSEIAFGKLFSAYPDMSIEPRSGSVDFVVEGIRVDIKSTSRSSGQLLATPKKKNEPADIYVLAIVQENIVNFVGFAKAEELLDDSTLTDLGHGPTHALPQHRLHSLSDVDLVEKV